MNSSYPHVSSALKANVKAFRSGKRDFSTVELNEIKIHLLKFKELLSETVFFEGKVKDLKVVSCFSEQFQFYDELSEYMFNKLNASISLIVILSERKVFLYRNQANCNIDICNLAKLLCDGECEDLSTDIATGKITEKFLKFTKTLQACTTPKI